MSKYLEYFEGAFDASVAEKMKPENKPYVAYSKTDGMVYTIIPKEEGTMYTIYATRKKDIHELEYNVVDLGLPSGTLWADRNVGALSMEDGGTYFAWGEIEGVNYIGVTTITAGELAKVLSESTEFVEYLEELGIELTADNVHEFLTIMYEGDPGYILLNDVFEMGFSLDKTYSWNNYFDVNKEAGYDEYDDPISFKKYNNEGGLTTLAPEDDAATVHMGSEWRMPTIGEIQELIDNTTITFVDIQGNEYTKEEASNDMIEHGYFKGVKLKAANGCSLWLPATDHIEEVYCRNNELSEAYYLSSDLSKTDNRLAESLYIQQQGNLSYDNAYAYRHNGYSIRGVKA